MRVIQELSLPGTIGSVDVSPSGERAAVVVEDSTAHLLRRVGETWEPEVVLPLAGGGEDDALPYARAAFVGEEYLVVQGQHGNTAVAAFGVDLATGARTERFVDEAALAGVFGPPPMAISPRHVLVQTLDNVLCLEVPSLREALRVRHYDAEGGIVGEGDAEDLDEQVAGFAFDLASSTLHVLWSIFNRGSLTGYGIDPDAGTCERSYQRADICTDVPAGLCLTPGGGLTALSLTMDTVAVPPAHGGGTSESPPYFAPLGFLCLVDDAAAEGEPRRIDIRSALLRDFYWGFHHLTSTGEHSEKATGVRLSALESVGANPFYTGRTRVVVPSPGGFLIEIDTRAGAESDRLDLGAPLAALGRHAPSRTILAACEEGKLVVVTAAAA